MKSFCKSVVSLNERVSQVPFLGPSRIYFWVVPGLQAAPLTSESNPEVVDANRKSVLVASSKSYMRPVEASGGDTGPVQPRSNLWNALQGNIEHHVVTHHTLNHELTFSLGNSVLVTLIRKGPQRRFPHHYFSLSQQKKVQGGLGNSYPSITYEDDAISV